MGRTPDTVQCNIIHANHAASLHLILTQLVGGTPDTVQCNIININHAASVHLMLTELAGGTPDTLQGNTKIVLGLWAPKTYARHL